MGQVNDNGNKIIDFDGQTELKLYECSYKIGPVEAPRLIKKGNPVLDYDFISNFHHPVAVQVENYFNNQCLIISLVNGTFGKWLASKEKEHLFTEQGRMLPLLRDMIIDLAGLVEKLLVAEKVPTELTLKNLYVRILHDGTPKLQVLVTEVREASTTALKTGAWEAVKDIIAICFRSHGVVQDEATESFCSFIGIPLKNIERLLMDFPDQWDTNRKAMFLMESCANADQVRVRINYHSGLEWPRESDGCYPELLVQLMRQLEQKVQYNENYPYDYVLACRNGFKHFNKLPSWLQARLGGDTDGLLRQIEQWTPTIWCKLYVAIIRIAY